MIATLWTCLQNGLVLSQRFWEKQVQIVNNHSLRSMNSRFALIHCLVLAIVGVISLPAPAQVSAYNYNGTNAHATTWASQGDGIVAITARPTSGSNVLTFASSVAGIAPGMIASGSGLPGNTVVLSTTANTVTVSLNATTTSATNVAYTFLSPWNFTRTGTVSVGTTQLSELVTTADLAVGMKVVGPGLTGAVTITNINSSTEVEFTPAATSTPNPATQTYTFALPNLAGGVGKTVTLNLDFAPGRNLPGRSKDLGIIQEGVTVYNGTIDFDPTYSSLNVNVVDGVTASISRLWSTIRGSSHPSDYSVTYNADTRGVQVTILNASLVNSATTNNLVGKVIRASYTASVAFTNTQIGDAVERIGQTNNSTLTFGPVTLAASPTAGSLAVSDGVFLWTEKAGSTNQKQFAVTWVPATRQVTVTYDSTESSGSGRPIMATYARAGAPAVILNNLVIGDTNGGETVGLRLNSLTLSGLTADSTAKIIKTVGGDDEISSNINLASTGVLAVRTGGNGYNSFRVGGTISGTGDLVKRDSGSLTIMGNNTYTGATFIPTTGGTTFLRSTPNSDAAISSSMIYLGNSNRDGNASTFLQLEGSEQINDAATIQFDGASNRWAYFKMMGFSERVGSINDYSGNGVIEVVETDNGVGTNSTLTVAGNGDSFYNGFIRDKAAVLDPLNNTGLSSGRMSITKDGTGMLTLSGNQISYSGPTVVNAGTLRLTNINNPLGGNLPSGTNAATAPRFSSDITNNSRVELFASTDWAYGSELNGSGQVVKLGGNTIRITNELDYTGTTTVSEGVLRLQGGLPSGFERDGNNFFIRNASDGNRITAITGSGRLSATTNIHIAGGNLLIDNNAEFNERDGTAGSYGRVHNSATISSAGGTLQFNHNAGEVSYREVVGSLSVGAGNLILQMSRAAEGGYTSEFSLNTISHTKGGTLALQGTGAGGQKSGNTPITNYNRNFVTIASATPLQSGILGGWAVTTNSKVNADENAITDVDFLTIVGGRLQAFDNYDTVSGTTNQQNTWVASRNIRFENGGTLTISGQGPAPARSLNRTINSLYFDSGAARTLNLGGRVLTIQTGGIIARGNNHIISSGTLTAGDAGGNYELFTHVADNASRIFTISASIRNNGNNPVTVVKSGPGRLILGSTTNTYTGGTYINQGVVEIRAINNLGTSVGPKSDFLHIDGGVLTIQQSAAGITFDVQKGITLGERGGSFAVPSGKVVTIESSITGPGDLNMGGAGAGSGRLILSGENTFTGRLRVDIGNLELTTRSGINSSNMFSDIAIEGGNLIVKAESVLPQKARLAMNLGNVILEDNARFGALSGTGQIVTVGTRTAPVNLVINQDENTTFNGRLGENFNSVNGQLTVMNLEKRGKGVLRLNASDSYYSGATIISEGVLAVANLGGWNGPSSIGSANVNPRDVSTASLLQIADGAGLSYVGDTVSFMFRGFQIGTGSEGASIYANGARVGDILRMRRRLLFDRDNISVIDGEDLIEFSTPNQEATLVLGGLNTGLNTFEMPLADNGTGRLNLTKTGTGTWLLGEADAPEEATFPFQSNYSGTTTIYGGTLRVVADTALGAAGGPDIDLIGGNLDIDVQYSRAETLAMGGGRLRTFAPKTGVASWAGDVRLDVASTIEVFGSNRLDILGKITGNASLRKEGFGTLVLSNNNTFRGGTTVAEGTLRLDYRTNALSKLSDSSGLILGGGRQGGTLDIIGGTSSVREDVSSLTLFRGQNRITRSDPASAVRLRLNGFTINQGAVLDIQQTSTAFAEADRNNVNGILGGWITLGGNSWAMNQGDSNDQPIVAVSSFTANTWQNRAQTTVTQDATITNGFTNSLRFNAPASNTLTLVGDNTIFTNGILQTPAVGSNSNIITGGRLLLEPNREGGFLYLHQNSIEGNLTIRSEIANGQNITGATFNYAMGTDTLTLAAGSTERLAVGMTISGPGIDSGSTILAVTANSIQISSNTSALGAAVAPHLGGSSTMVVNTISGNATLNVTSGTTVGLVVGQPITGPNIPAGSIITGYTPSTISISQAATLTASNVSPVTGGVNNLIVSTVNGSGALTVVSGSSRQLYIGMPISGPGIPANAVISSFTGERIININLAATADSPGIAPVVSGRNGVVKAGAGRARLSGDNTFSGPLEIVGGVLSVPVINNGGTVGPLGTSDTTASNLTISSGTLQYTGNSGVSDRGFLINELGRVDVTLTGTDIAFTGNLSGGTGSAFGRLVKTGTGVLTIRRDRLTGGSGNIGSLEVETGRLALVFNNPNQENIPNQAANNRFAASTAGVVLSGGTLELVGLDNTPVAVGEIERSENRTQQLFGSFVVQRGSSTVKVTGGRGTTTLLELQDSSNPQSVVRESGGSVHFVENPNGGSASIRLAVPVEDASVAIPWATFQDTSYIIRPGVNNFAAVETLDGGIISADSKNLYRIRPDPATWTSVTPIQVVSEAGDAFNGTTPLTNFYSGDSVGPFALRYFSPKTSSITVGDHLVLGGGSILVGSNVGTGSKLITGGALTSLNKMGDADRAYHDPGNQLLSTAKLFIYDLMVHNYNPQADFRIASAVTDQGVVDAPRLVNGDTRAHPVNFIHVGIGTTTLEGTNTYTGNTFANGGVILLQSTGALPGGIGTASTGSNLTFDGGMVGLGATGTFTRSLGTGPGQVRWLSSGGFAAYGADRTVNLGGSGEEVTWASGNFVPDGASLNLGTGKSTHKVTWQNPIDLGGGSREVSVEDGFAAVDAEMVGVLSGLGGSLHKVGYGTLRISGANTQTGGLFASAGTTIIANGSLGNGTLGVAATSNSKTGDYVKVVLEGGTITRDLLVGNFNSGGATDIRVSGRTTVTGNLLFGNGARPNFNVDPGRTLTVTGNIDEGKLLVSGGGTLVLNGNWTNNDGGAADDFFTGGAIVRHGNLVAGANNSLGRDNTNLPVAVELGDAAFKAGVVGAVDRVSAGRSLTEQGALFDPLSSGVPGSNNGRGAFLFGEKTSIVIDGYTYTSADVGKRILVQSESERPETNGIYQVVYFAGGTGSISLTRVSDFDQFGEILYGGRVSVLNGSESGQTFYVATGTITPNVQPLIFRKETSLNPNVGLLLGASGLDVSNPIDINSTNGTGITTLGGAVTFNTGSSQFSGRITLRNTLNSAAEQRTVRLVSETSDGAGVVFSNIISEVATQDRLGFLKQGLGSVTLTGDNTFKGGVVVEEGSLIVSNTTGSGTGTGAVSVMNAGTLLGGSGRIAGATTMGVGTVLSPGDSLSIASGLERLEFGDNLSLGGDTTVILQIGSSSHDSISVAGNLLLSGATLFEIILNYTPGAAAIFDLIDWGTLTMTTGSLSDGLDLPELAAATLYWDTSRFDSHGELAIAEGAGGATPPPVRFAVKALQAVEGDVLRLAIQSNWPAPSPVTVNLSYPTSGDLTGPASVVIPTGLSSVVLSIDVFNDPLTEADEKHTVRITSVVGGIKGAPSAVTVSVSDNDSARPLGSDWTLRNPLPNGADTIREVAHRTGSPDLIAVGRNGLLLRSINDGTDWTKLRIPLSQNLNGVVWTGTEWVVVGDEGVLLTSPDGQAWTVRSLGTSAALFDVSFINDQIYIVGENGSLYSYSYALGFQNWVLLNSGTSAPLYAVAGNATRIVAVGQAGVITSSADGTTWSLQTTTGTADLLSVAASSSSFVAVGAGGVTEISADGVNWTTGTTGAAANMNDIFWNGSLFLAVGDQGLTRSSPTGSAWAVTGTMAPVGNLSAVSFGGTAPGRWVTAGRSGLIGHSANAAAWTRSGSGPVDDLEGIYRAVAQNIYVAVGGNGRLLTSPNAITWTQRSTPPGTPKLLAVAANATRIVAVGESGSLITSINGGGAWTAGNSTVGVTLESITFGAGVFVAVGADGTVITSPDGVAWTVRSSDVTQPLKGITVNSPTTGTRFVIVGSAGTILTSTTGFSWSAASAVPTSVTFNEVEWTGSQYVAVGAGGVIVTSSDGDNWVRRSSGVLTELRGITMAGDRLIATGVGGVALQSPAGNVWTKLTTGTGVNLQDVAYDGGSNLRLAAVGSGGLIMTTELTPAPPPQVFFALSQQSVTEGGVTKVNVEVRLNPAASTDVRVPVTVAPGASAFGNVHYKASLATPLLFKKGKTSLNIVVTLINDAVPEIDRQFTLVLGQPVELKPSNPPRVPVRAGPFEHQFTILDDDDPLGVTDPVQQIVELGQPLNLSVVATGGDRKTTQWRRNGARIAGATAGTYSVAAAQVANGGRYDHVVTNPAPDGSLTSAGAEVVIIDKASRAVPSLAGSTVVLKAIAGGNGLAYRWHRNGNPITADGGAFTGTGTPNLTISPLSVTEEDDYTCQIVCAAADPDLVDFTGTQRVRIAQQPIISLPGSVTGGFVSGSDVTGVVGSFLSVPPVVDTDPARAPVSFRTAAKLPAGLKFDTKTGIISGIPSAATLAPVAITVEGINPFATPGSFTFNLSIQPVPGNAIGTFVADVARNTGVNGGHGGRVDVITTAVGSYTASVTLRGVKYSGKGYMNTLLPNPTATVSISRKAPLPPITLNFTITTASNSMTGSVVIGADTAAISSGWRNVWSKLVPAAPYKGLHNIAFGLGLTDDGNAAIPQGSGFASLRVNDLKGTVAVTGRASDGSALSSTAPIGPAGQVLIYTSLYKGTGSFKGVVNIASDAGHTVTDSVITPVTWNKTAQSSPKERVYRAGWPTITLGATGGLYTPPVAKPSPTPPVGTPPQIILAVKERGSRLFIARSGNGAIADVGSDGTSLNNFTVALPENPISTAVDVIRGKVYWTAPSAIGVANLDGTAANPNLIPLAPGSGVGGIAVDPENGKIFWAQTGGTNNGGIMTALLDGTGVTEVTSSEPTIDLALSYIQTMIYYVVPDNNDILKVGYTGELEAGDTTGIAVLDAVPDGLQFTGIGILQQGVASGAPFDEGRLYWSYTLGIGSSNFGGGSPQLDLVRLPVTPSDVCVDAATGQIFWATGNTLGRAKLDGSSPAASFVSGLGSSGGLDIASMALDNALISFNEGGVGLSATNPNVPIQLRTTARISLLGSNAAKTTVTLNTATGAFNGGFTLSDTAGKRAVKYAGVVVPDPSTNTTVKDKLDGVGTGYFLLNQLPDNSVVPPTKLTNSPILSGQVLLEATD
jgi:autotransporter-associated beta strand protein